MQSCMHGVHRDGLDTQVGVKVISKWCESVLQLVISTAGSSKNLVKKTNVQTERLLLLLL